MALPIKKQAADVKVGETIKFRVGLEFHTGKVTKVEVNHGIFGLTVDTQVFGEVLWHFAGNFELDIV